MAYTSKIAIAEARWNHAGTPTPVATPDAVVSSTIDLLHYAPVSSGPLWPFLADDLDRARIAGEIAIIYQPIVNSASCEVVAYEALARWTHPRFGVISPEQLMAVAAASGGMEQLGRWLVREACHEAATWDGRIALHVNLTVGQLEDPMLTPVVAALLAESSLPATRLQIEVSEYCRIDDVSPAVESLANLRAMGVRVTLDDFGVGSANLATLCRLPLDSIKIHRSFVETLDHDATARTIVRGILELANDLDLHVIADGVETTAQLRFLRNHGCRDVQGFLIARPGGVPSRLAA